MGAGIHLGKNRQHVSAGYCAIIKTQ